MTFEEFFFKATEQAPFPYQVRLATGPHLPDLLQAPTGAGKTAAAVLGWLWRRRFAEAAVRGATPRRLVYCLPMRVLVEQTHDNAATWLARLGLAADDDRRSGEVPVNLVVLMGGEEEALWDLQPDCDAIIIGTQDMLLSRALNRGYGMSRYRWPLHFALLGNDCFWVYDEVQLMGPGLATSAQLAAFHRSFGGFGPAHELWMSATLKREWLTTYDLAPAVPGFVDCELDAGDETSPFLAARLSAAKTISFLDPASDNPSDAAKLAEAIRSAHEPGTLTLAVANTVARATKLYESLEKLLVPGKQQHGLSDGEDRQCGAEPELLLLHSRFRPPERQTIMAKLMAQTPPQGRIVISTQVIEAGVDLSATTLFTELAPWPSLVQRFGRCNRYGEHDRARVFVIDLTTGGRGSQAPPYEDADLDRARAALAGLDDVGLLNLQRHLSAMESTTREHLYHYETDHLLRRRDFVELFDTTPDLAGNDIDISRFIRASAETDVQLFWRDLASGQAPDVQTAAGAAPSRNELCSIPVSELCDFLAQGHVAFVWDYLGGQWKRALRSDLAPGHMYLIAASEGGYLTTRGWSPKSRVSVTMLLDAEAAKSVLPEANDSELAAGQQQTLKEHTEEIVAEVDGLIRQLGWPSDSEFAQAVHLAARWHDRGKAHPVFQVALSGHQAVDGDGTGGNWPPVATEILAKSGHMAQLRYRRRGFRHELAGALAALQADLPDLACYLVAAHHGKVRLSIRSLPQETKPGDAGKRFARGVWDGDTLPEVDLGAGRIAPLVTLSLQPAELGLSAQEEPSWAERMLRLRDKASVGPYRLAFLEALVRVADMRASARAAKDHTNATFERRHGSPLVTPQEGNEHA